MPTPHRCFDCGKELSREDQGGLCVRCLFKLGLNAGEAVAAPVTQKPGNRIGHYKLLEKIGEGGCGIVYMAEQERPVRRRVALKIIKLGMDTQEVIARFEAERQALAMMDHPNIAKVLDAGATDAGRPFFVMELVRGDRITECCDDLRLPTRERLNLFIKVCQAIQHAHQKGIIHRDIKPSNILVSLNEGVPVPKVIDFGIAKATEGRLTDRTLLTAFQQFLGTPAYMSPEQVEMTSLDIDTRSDIYSLGVLLYELLTGKTPFGARELQAAGLDAMRRTIREKEPVRPSMRLGTLPASELNRVAKDRSSDAAKLTNSIRGDLDWIVMKCLEKDRARRYETANGLAADLKRHLGNEPVVARPASAGYRFQKTWRRNKLLFGAVATVAAALVLGIGVSTWQAITANRARTEASQSLYVANMNLAQLAWEQNNLHRMWQLLEECASHPRRGFEWYYWKRQAHLELKSLRGHNGRINAVAFSPDGQRVLTGADRTAKIWDAASGRELLTLRGHSGELWSVAFSPDGQRVLTGGTDRTARAWDAGSGRQLLALQGHSGKIWSVAFSPDGRRVLTGSEDNTARLWDAVSGRELLTLSVPRGSISSVAFSPDNQWLITADGDGRARILDAASGRERVAFNGHRERIYSVAFSPDGRRVLTGSGDETARVWDAASGLPVCDLKGHSDVIRSVAFSPDGQRALTGSEDQTARVWDVASGRQLLIFKSISQIRAVAFSPDGQWVLTGSEDQTARVWAAASTRERVTLHGHRDELRSMAFSPDGQRVLTGSEDQTARIWDAASGRELLALQGHGNEISSVAFSPDGRRVLTGSLDKTAKVWDAVSGQELLTLQGHSNWVMSVAYSPDGRRVLTGSGGHMHWTNWSGAMTAKVWDAVEGRELVTLAGHRDQILSAAFSPDSQRILTGSEDNTARMWDAASGKELLTLRGHSYRVMSVAFSRDGRRVITSGGDRTAKVWDAASGRELLTLKGHSDRILSTAFSPDGQRVLTGSEDDTAKLWDAVNGRELLTFKGHSARVLAAAFSPDGQRVLTGSEDQTTRVWESASSEQVAHWRQEERAAELMAAQGRDYPAFERAAAARAQDAGAFKP